MYHHIYNFQKPHWEHTRSHKYYLSNKLGMCVYVVVETDIIEFNTFHITEGKRYIPGRARISSLVH